MIKGTLTRKVGLAAIATLTAFMGLAPFAPGASAAANYDQVRYDGVDRFDTAALIAGAIAEATPTAILARADIYPDALTGAFAAAANGEGPMLLTQSNAVPDRTLDALEDEAVDNVILLGGPAAISPTVETQLETAGYAVDRIFGSTRYQTAIEIAEQGAGIIGTVDGERSALLSSGENFPDALAGAPLSFAAGLPSLLTPSNIDDSAKTAIFNEVVDAMNGLNIQQVFLLGGPNAVSQGIEDALVDEGFNVTRLHGGDRHSTSVEIFEFGLDKDIYTNRRFGLARSDTFPDALAYAPLAGRPRTSPAPATGLADTGGDANGLLLTPSCTLATSVEEFLTENQATWTEGEILGGEVAICEAVADEVEEIASVGDAARATVTVSDTDVERGGQITGRITGEDIASVKVSGCGFTNQTVTRDAEGDFTLNLPISQTEDCTLTFTTTFDDGTTQTDTVAINVTAPAGNATATVRPELVTATIGATSAAGTLVTYCFDEEVTGATTPDETLFHVYAANGDNQYDGSGTGTITGASNNCVEVNFAAITTASNLVSTLTVATVDFGAVTDNEGSENPIGDAPIGSGQQVTLVAGETAAPDLLSVTNCAPEPTGAGADTDATAETRCTFTFDETAYTVTPAGFHLVLTTGEQINCVAVSGAEGGTSTTAAETASDTTIVADCEQTATSGPIATSAVARGFVDAGAVSDAPADQATLADNNESASDFSAAEGEGCDVGNNDIVAADCVGNLNALQATDSPDLVTPAPDLESATLGAETTANDTIIYDFDQTVQTTVNNASFCYYVANGDQTCGTGTAVRGTGDDTTVVVTFAEGTLNQAVGASVLDGAVNNVNTVPNQEDEEGMANSNQSATQSGRTDNPDLVGVALQSSSTSPTFAAVYTFDEDVDQFGIGDGEATLATAGDFFLIAADGTRYVATECETRTVGEGTPVGTEDTDNQVRCTDYAVANNDGTATTVNPTDNALMQAVVGTVDDGAVTEEVGAGTNPEGAELTAGTTGSPMA